MRIDADYLSVHKIKDNTCVTMPSAAFACILKRFLAIGSDPEIDALNDGAKFSTRGGLGNGKILIKLGEMDITNVGKAKTGDIRNRAPTDCT